MIIITFYLNLYPSQRKRSYCKANFHYLVIKTTYYLLFDCFYGVNKNKLEKKSMLVVLLLTIEQSCCGCCENENN